MTVHPEEAKKLSPLQRMQQNWIIQFTYRGTVVIIGGSLILIVLHWSRLPTQVPLWYSLPWGSDQLAAPIWLFVLPMTSALIFGLNAMISIYLLAEYLIFAQLALTCSLLASLLSFISLVKILTIIT